MEQDRLEACQEAVGYRFREPFWLQKALTHSSNRNDQGLSNERMEFLGDAILGGVVSEFLFRSFPDYTEGDLTQIKSAVVSRETLSRLGETLKVGPHWWMRYWRDVPLTIVDQGRPRDG